MFILLVGPKGSGKSHIGRILEERLGVHFCHVEPLWMDYYARCRAAGQQPTIPEGMAAVHPHITRALKEHAHVCVETTGASPEILNDLLRLALPAATLAVRVRAPLALCLERIAARDQTHQVPMDTDSIRRMYALSEGAAIQPQLVIDNQTLSAEEIVVGFAGLIAHNPSQRSSQVSNLGRHHPPASQPGRSRGFETRKAGASPVVKPVTIKGLECVKIKRPKQ
jgi:shikimate kinase